MSALPKSRDASLTTPFDAGVTAFNALSEDEGIIDQVKQIDAALAGFSAQASLTAARSVNPETGDDSPAQYRLRAAYLRHWAAMFVKVADNMNAEASRIARSSHSEGARYDA